MGEPPGAVLAFSVAEVRRLQGSRQRDVRRGRRLVSYRVEMAMVDTDVAVSSAVEGLGALRVDQSGNLMLTVALLRLPSSTSW
ncbi:hypothetical protein H4W31_004006 [Plantactinospora soyae]|uniref:Uncharacterized protein n=1 Tax=Plantactinospora soyae TaxID=1544732 RepID=A0A927R081_9ACTN|nr:hypothetical protein [Plantactinospora soyae]